jgi:DNA-binding CsgD family transcriptional regulator
MEVAMNEKNPLRLVEAAYSFDESEQEWLERLIDALEPYDLGKGIAAYISELGERIAVRSFASRALAIDPTAVHAMASFLPAPFYRRIHAPTPLVSNLEAFPIAARDVGMTFGKHWPEETPFMVPQAAWAIAGGDVERESVLITFHCDPGKEYSARDRQALDCVAAHLGSVLRLRAFLRGAKPSPHAVDAVISPDGKVLDARGELRPAEGHVPLIDAIRRSERAKLRSATADEKLAVWTALVEGKWSVLETVEQDGKRLFLACRNDPRTRPLHLLTPRERSVVTYAALGHSFKYMAYELGVSITNVGATLDTALRKLGLQSRAELIPLFAQQPPS